MRRLRFILAGLGMAALLALVVVGCGGDDDSDAEETQATTAAQQQSDGQRDGSGSGGSSNQGGDQQDASEPQGGSANITDSNPEGDNPPSKRELRITAGADNSLQTFGEDVGGDERSEVIDRMNGYFAALAQGIEEACPYFTDAYKQSLGQLSQGQGGGGSGDCAALARTIEQTSPPGALRAEARYARGAEILRVGIEDDNAIVIFRARNGQLRYFTMQNVDGEWQVFSLLTVPVIPPSS